MKKIIVFAVAVFAFVLPSEAWSDFGHRVAVQVAERHLKKAAKDNLARYFDYDIAEDASWMDYHRNDKDIAYTTRWHINYVYPDGKYCPMPSAKRGDCVRALHLCTYNLSHYKDLPDSEVVFNVRMLIHMVGDLHCPTHTFFIDKDNFWECTIGTDGRTGSFHGFYDMIPELIYEGKTTETVAELVDNFEKMEMSQVCKGSFEDWVTECGTRNLTIYEINPVGTYQLANDTVWRSVPLVSEALRNAGVRLATLLNKYFSK